MKKTNTIVMTSELITDIQRMPVKETYNPSINEGSYVISDAQTEAGFESAQRFGFTCYETPKIYAITQGWKLALASSSLSSTPPLF